MCRHVDTGWIDNHPRLKDAEKRQNERQGRLEKGRKRNGKKEGRKEVGRKEGT